MKLSSPQLLRSIAGALACAAWLAPTVTLAQIESNQPESSRSRYTYVETQKKRTDAHSMPSAITLHEEVTRPPFEDHTYAHPTDNRFAGPLDQQAISRFRPVFDHSTSPQLAPQVDHAAFATGQFREARNAAVQSVSMQQNFMEQIPDNRRQDPEFTYVMPSQQQAPIVTDNIGRNRFNTDSIATRSFVDRYQDQFRIYPGLGRTRLPGINPASVCDEWANFCNCGSGFKTNPGHWGLPWLKSNELCETSQCESGCRDRGCKRKAGKCRHRDGNDGSCDCDWEEVDDRDCDCSACANQKKRGLFKW